MKRICLRNHPVDRMLIKHSVLQMIRSESESLYEQSAVRKDCIDASYGSLGVLVQEK